jgi:Mg/Co/Ni transporter MgtE
MAARDAGCVVVVDRDHAVVGIVTDRDIALTAAEEGLPLKGMPVASAMTHHPVVVRADDTLEEAMRLMRTQQCRRLPVVDGQNRLIGLLTIGDIVRVTASVRRRGEDQAASDALVETLAAIGERRPVNVAALVCST